MTRRDHVIQWLAYAVALLLTAGLEGLVLSRLPFFGVIPVLLPLALTACATLEGPRAGAGFGIAVGALMSVAAGGGPWRIVVCSAAGLGVGLVTRYVLRQDFVGHLLCSLLVLLGRMAWCVGTRAAAGAAGLPVLLGVGVPELLWSMVFSGPVYLLFRFICRRWGRIYYNGY